MTRGEVGQYSGSARLVTLGACAVYRNEQVVEGAPHGLFRIAAYILLSGHEWASRQRLRTLLWTDLDSLDRASANLRQTLARIRAFQTAHELDLLKSGVNAVQLVKNTRVHWDLRIFIDALGRQDFLAASAVYYGDLLADSGASSSEFEDWLMGQRDWLRSRLIEGLTGLIADEENVGPSANEAAGHILGIDPSHELAFRVRMRAAASTYGSAHELERMFSSFQRQVEREYGVGASARTRALFQTLHDELVTTQDDAASSDSAAGSRGA